MVIATPIAAASSPATAASQTVDCRRQFASDGRSRVPANQERRFKPKGKDALPRTRSRTRNEAISIPLLSEKPQIPIDQFTKTSCWPNRKPRPLISESSPRIEEEEEERKVMQITGKSWQAPTAKDHAPKGSQVKKTSVVSSIVYAAIVGFELLATLVKFGKLW